LNKRPQDVRPDDEPEIIVSDLRGGPFDDGGEVGLAAAVEESFT
jgi:hypothetical protein